ncbi:SnoaL-like domain-containing protein [Leptodontidium sp. 2 PMI_412]|nr:SnoaL-like domain-containing protein [Leptodontidium sp. 2 PMI_412]
MRLSIVFLGILAPLSLALPLGPNKPDVYEAIHQVGFKLAHTLDTKNWAALRDLMAEDVVYDNSALGTSKGGISNGLDEVIANTKAAFGDSLVSHVVANSLIDLDSSGKKAYVIFYLIFSLWDPNALDDPKKTFRVYEKCNDIYVLSSGVWKMSHSTVTNMGPKFEMPYFG